LTGIRKRQSRKDAGRSLHSWAFHQLQQFITYKAQMAGVTVELVDPKHTSQTCKCGHVDKHNRNGDKFVCTSCGYSAHADANAAMNIAKRTSQRGHSAAA
jgi:transposase